MYKIILTILFLATINSLYGQIDPSLKDVQEFFHVDSIKIIGNDITQEFVILGELTFKVGDKITDAILEFNKERLYSMRIFTFVELIPNTKENINVITITVKEAWYIYPWPFIRLHHSSWEYASYGFYLRWKNFLGRNESIRTTVALGYDPYYKIDYYNPYLLKKEKIYFSIHSAYQKFQNKSDYINKLYGNNIEYRIISNYISLGKRHDQFNYISTLWGFNYIEIDEQPLEGVTASKTKIDRIPFIMLAYTYDTRDLIQYPQNGTFVQFSINHKGFGINNIGYNIFSFDYRTYWNFYDDFVARGRVALRSGFGGFIPNYDYSYLGFDELVRGHSRDVQEGYNSLMGTFELSYPIFKEWNFSLDLPLIPERITSTRIGMHVYFFADTGMTFMDVNKLTMNELYSGWGIGINILFLPYSGMRLEYAINEFRQGEFLIGTDYSF